MAAVCGSGQAGHVFDDLSSMSGAKSLGAKSLGAISLGAISYGGVNLPSVQPAGKLQQANLAMVEESILLANLDTRGFSEVFATVLVFEDRTSVLGVGSIAETV